LTRQQPSKTNSIEEEPSHLRIPAGEEKKITLILESEARVELTVVKKNDDGTISEEQRFKLSNIQKHPSALLRKLAAFNWQMVFFIAALAIYLTSRFIALDSFPIYFFSDEAIQTVRANDLVRNDFHYEKDEFLPTYLINGGQYNLGVSVYIQIIPSLIFGNSIWVTRGVCVLFSLFAVLGVGLAAKNIFKSGLPAIYILLLSTLPAWFLHSRTGFETALATSFYSAFLYCYMMYRQGRSGYLYAAAAFGALTFFSYSPAQVVMAVTALALFLSDLRYHLRHWKPLLVMLGMCAVFAIPYLRYLVNHPGENYHHLLILNSYLIRDTTVWQKLAEFFKLYWQNINPAYWFFPNDVDLIRHIMKGYGNLGLWSLPLILFGLVNCFRHIKESPYRLVLIAALAAPTGASLAGTGVTRLLFMVIPVALLAGLGVDQLIAWLKRIRISTRVSAGVLLAALIGLNTYMVYDAVKNAPYWFQDYGLSGLQYGAKELFGASLQYMEEHPDEKLIISSQWANGSDTLARFFFTKPLPYAMGSIEQWLEKQMPLDDSYTFVVIPEEMKLIAGNPKFKSLQVLQTLQYPDGITGFYFIKVAYADNIAQIFTAEADARHQLVTEITHLRDGTEVVVQHPELDMGKLLDAFDGNPATVIRSKEANPMNLVLQFPTQPIYSSITLRVGGNPTLLEVTVVPADGSSELKFTDTLPVSGDYRNITYTFASPIAVQEIRISIKNSESGEPDHVHLWEITLK
jgi:hypothetical protein